MRPRASSVRDSQRGGGATPEHLYYVHGSVAGEESSPACLAAGEQATAVTLGGWWLPSLGRTGDSAGVVGDRASHNGLTPAPGSRRKASPWCGSSGSPALLVVAARCLLGAVVGRRPAAGRIELSHRRLMRRKTFGSNLSKKAA